MFKVTLSLVTLMGWKEYLRSTRFFLGPLFSLRRQEGHNGEGYDGVVRNRWHSNRRI